MKLSDLGLPADEVDKIMSDLLQTPAGGGSTTQERQPEQTKGVEGPKPQEAVIRVNEATPAKDNTKSTDVGTSLIPVKQTLQVRATVPPAAIPPGMPAPGVQKKTSVGLVLAGAGTGFFVGGPVGAVVGAGAGWLVGKGSAKPAPAPAASLPPKQAVGPKMVQVTPTSTPATPAVKPPQTRTFIKGK